MRRVEDTTEALWGSKVSPSTISELKWKIRLQMETLRRHQEDFAQITGNMREALVLLDHAGRVISANPAAERLFGTDCLQTGAEFSAGGIPDMEQAVRTAREKGHFEFRENTGFRTYQFDISRIESTEAVHGLVILAFDVTEQEGSAFRRSI